MKELKDISTRLKSAKKKFSKSYDKKPQTSGSSLLGVAFKMSTELVAAVLIGTFIGFILDSYSWQLCIENLAKTKLNFAMPQGASYPSIGILKSIKVVGLPLSLLLRPPLLPSRVKIHPLYYFQSIYIRSLVSHPNTIFDDVYVHVYINYFSPSFIIVSWCLYI